MSSKNNILLVFKAFLKYLDRHPFQAGIVLLIFWFDSIIGLILLFEHYGLIK